MVPGRKLDCAIWEFTLECNLRCSHCGSSAGKPRPDELSTEEAFRVCEMLAGVGCREVSLMGGEPLLRRDFRDVARCVKQLGMKLSVVSNGILMEDHADELSELRPEVVGISLDGMRENHEKIRGPGTWDKAVRAVDLLRTRDIQTTVITTVSKINFRDLPEMRDLVKDRGANWQIQVAMPFGNFKREQTLSKEEYYASAMFIAKERLRPPEERVRVIGAHCYGYFSKVLPGCSGWTGCTAGISSIGITSDGGGVGCLSMGNDRFIEGNLRERTLDDLWNSPDSFGYTRKFTKDDLGENCNRCRHWRKCGGGCNSVSMSLTGRFHNDPYCFLAIEKEGTVLGRRGR
ncbi:TPA: radical SAM protein [Thermoplasmata archaeon]|nr:radical SAM protein [Thermoplasmata archaeon]